MYTEPLSTTSNINLGKLASPTRDFIEVTNLFFVKIAVYIMIKMGAIPESSKIGKKSSSSMKSIVMIGGVLGAIFAVGLAYMFFYVAPEEVIERVEVIAVTQEGCIAETADGFATNIGQCIAEPGEFVMAPIDQKVKERQLAMNPTGR